MWINTKTGLWVNMDRLESVSVQERSYTYYQAQLEGAVESGSLVLFEGTIQECQDAMAEIFTCYEAGRITYSLSHLPSTPKPETEDTPIPAHDDIPF